MITIITSTILVRVLSEEDQEEETALGECPEAEHHLVSLGVSWTLVRTASCIVSTIIRRLRLVEDGQPGESMEHRQGLDQRLRHHHSADWGGGRRRFFIATVLMVTVTILLVLLH
jgi:hypothetical protein